MSRSDDGIMLGPIEISSSCVLSKRSSKSVSLNMFWSFVADMTACSGSPG